jgi:predicted dehydrogenase
VSKFGIGFLAAGPVAQSIHIPAVRRYVNDLEIAHIMDIDSELAEKLADQHGAKWTTDEDVLINDPDVQIVVVGSPNNHHARQVIKACEAGKKLVLAEKPLATSTEELDSIRAAAEKSGTAIVVGAMHAFDTAYLEALKYWKTLDQTPSSIEVSCYLPPNAEFVDLATTLITPTDSAAPVGGGPRPSPDIATKMANGILGLAMHDIPLIRDFLPALPELDFATALTPFGYMLQGKLEQSTFRIIGRLPGEWESEWTFRAISSDAKFEIDFQPSYVLAGSGLVRVTTGDEVREFGNQLSAYEAEWEEILAIVSGGKKPRYSLARIEADTEFALSLVSQVKELVGE